MPGFEETLTGRVLAHRYLVEEVIGRGGMGAVYRALDQRLGRRVALKVIMVPGADAATHERLRQRFQREAQLAAGLRHPHVVTVHDFGTDDALGVDYLVMALLEGEDLASRTARGGRLSPAAALAVVSQAAQGLAAGHRRGLVHRDVKPGNLFLEVDEHGEAQVRVLDFGIAQVAFDEPALASAGRDPLSPTYAAPEQLRGGTSLTPAADVFSLAAVALFLLNGQRPFTGNPDTQPAEAEAALGRLAAVPGVTPAVRDVLRRALEMDPNRRWPDAHTFRRALESAHGTGLDALPASIIATPPPGHARGADDDVTLFADERTLHAGPGAMAPSRQPAPPYGAAGDAGRRGVGVAPPVRGSRAPVIVASAIALAAAGAALVYLQPWEARTPPAPAVAEAPDSATLDSLARAAEADSLARLQRQQALIQAAVDSARRADSIARAEQGLPQLPADSAVDAGIGQPPPVDGAYELAEVERPPRPRNMGDVTRYLQRNYPPVLRDAGVEGEVMVGFVIDADGRPAPGTLEVIGASHPGFEAPALRAVERMRFRPAQVGGRDVRVRVSLPIRFQLNR